jgi:hypothetical protein
MSARRTRAKLRGDAGPFAVLTKKESGSFTEFGRYSNEAEARNVCRLLAWAGAVLRLSGPHGDLSLEQEAK